MGAFLYLSAVLIIPPVIAYLAYVNLNLYLDLVLPIELYFIHLLYEVVRDYFHLKTHRASHPAASEANAPND